MIEKTIVAYLNRKGDVPAYMERKKEPDETYYWLIEKTGSSRTNKLKRATFAIQSYAPSLLEAASLNEKLINLMDKMTELDNISKCECVADYNYTNPSAKQYRYQAVFEIYHY